MSRFQVKQHPPCLQCKAFAANFFDANSHSGQGAVSQDLNLEILRHMAIFIEKICFIWLVPVNPCPTTNFPIFSKWMSSDFSIFSASKVRTGADRLWAPFQVISHDCSACFVDFLHQFIDYIDFVWFSLYHLLSSCQVSEFPHLWLGCLWPAKVMPKKGCSSRNPKFSA